MAISQINANSMGAASVPQTALGTNVAGTGPAFSAYANSTQALTGGVYTKIQCNTKEFDTNTNFDTSLYRFTPTVAGYYQVNANFSLAGTPAETYALIYKNGSSFKSGNDISTSYTSSINVLIYMNGSTDYIEFYGFTATNRSTNANSTNTYFQASLVRKA